MKIIWNEKEKIKHKKLSKKDKRYWLKLWRFLNWWKKKFPEFVKEVEEVIGE